MQSGCALEQEHRGPAHAKAPAGFLHHGLERHAEVGRAEDGEVDRAERAEAVDLPLHRPLGVLARGDVQRQHEQALGHRLDPELEPGAPTVGIA